MKELHFDSSTALDPRHVYSYRNGIIGLRRNQMKACFLFPQFFVWYRQHKENITGNFFFLMEFNC